MTERPADTVTVMDEKNHRQSSSLLGSPPPSYDQISVGLNAGLRNLVLDSGSSLPTVDLCIAHLKLLTAFHQLREDVATYDGLFGIEDKSVNSADPETRNTLIAKCREKRWAIYVVRAVDRFERWWDTSVPSNQQPLRQGDVALPPTTGKLRFNCPPPLGE